MDDSTAWTELVPRSLGPFLLGTSSTGVPDVFHLLKVSQRVKPRIRRTYKRALEVGAIDMDDLLVLRIAVLLGEETFMVHGVVLLALDARNLLAPFKLLFILLDQKISEYVSDVYASTHQVPSFVSAVLLP